MIERNRAQPIGQVLWAAVRRRAHALSMLAVVGALGLGWASTRAPRASRPPVPARLTSTPPAKAEASGPPRRASAPGTSDATAVCRIPGLSEGVPSFDIAYRPGSLPKFSGGLIEPGKYRLKGAWAFSPDFTPGRWTLTLDLAEAGQGAYYRPMGLRAASSRIQWSNRDGVFRLRTLCPDPGEALEYPYVARDGELWLLVEDSIVIVLEAYADSQVTTLTPIE